MTMGTTMMNTTTMMITTTMTMITTLAVPIHLILYSIIGIFTAMSSKIPTRYMK